MPRKRNSYRDDLHSRLKDPAYAAEYLNAVLEDSEDSTDATFLLALRDVAESFQMSKVAEEAAVSRENLYRMLSGRGNPRLRSLVGVIRALGLQLRVQPSSSATVDEEEPVQTHVESHGRSTRRRAS